MELIKEAKRQERNEELRKTFAQHGNAFHTWLTDTRLVIKYSPSTVACKNVIAIETIASNPIGQPLSHVIKPLSTARKKENLEYMLGNVLVQAGAWRCYVASIDDSFVFSSELL